MKQQLATAAARPPQEQQAAVANAHGLAPAVKLAPPPKRVTITANGIELYRPDIRLTEHIFIGNEQTNHLTPEKALITNGAIVIEELNLIIPLAGSYVRTG